MGYPKTLMTSYNLSLSIFVLSPRFLLYSMQCWAEKFANDVLERMWKDMVVAYFKVKSNFFPGTAKECNENHQSR
jgi:hypothetical protein